jgi:hypothetical protein
MAEEATGSTTSEAGGTEGKETPRTFTQEEIDRIVSDRLKRQKAQYEADLADHDDLKKAKAELDQLKAEQLSEIEKVTKRAEDAEAKLAERDADLSARELRDMRRKVLAAEAKERGITLDDEKLEALANGVTGTDEDGVKAVAETIFSATGAAPPAPVQADDLQPNLKQQHDEAMKAGNVAEVLRIKNQMITAT